MTAEGSPALPSVFIDADVLIAGSFSTTGAGHMILRLSELGLLDGVSSEQARHEAERNLASKLPAGLPAFRAIANAAIRWVPDPSVQEIAALEGQADPEDVPILAAAIRERCGSLVTFNIADFRPTASVRIETPGAFVRRLRSSLETIAEAPGGQTQ